MDNDVKSASRTIEVLDLLASHADGLTLLEIAGALGCPKSSAHALLATLARKHVVAATPTARGSVFKLGHHIFEIGQAYASNVDLIRDSHDIVRRLVDTCLETMHVAALDGGQVVYLAKEEGRQPMRMVSALGRRFPAYGTGVGKVLLAGLDDSAVRDLFPTAEQMPRLTPNTVDDPARLMAELAETRRRGYAVETEESSVGLGCIAVPLYDSSALVAAMSMSVPTARFPQERRDELLVQLQAGARELSMRLGASSYPSQISPATTRCL
ncbi:IclR family transcriptional regulator [Streptomyces sp. NPDC092129]|uniref:IclR family transcriptional regulator n=1 Tax=Streptomyces sp. NPDC092129 TaxID=3366010 RepID=UPI00380B2C86